MALKRSFQRGDEVLHPRRPEWGGGVVRQIEAIRHEGQPAQRLTVDFSQRGRVVINTAIASLVARGHATTMSSTQTSTASGGGWLATLERSKRTSHELWELPEAMTDPFATLPQRLAATLDSYRFSTEPRSLIEWAVAQTRLKDPLTKYTRQELELGFARFARDRDIHLKQLVQQLKRSGDRRSLDLTRRSLRLPQAQSAFDKAMNA